MENSGEHPHRKFFSQPQAEVQHLVIGLADRLLCQAGSLDQPQRADMGVIERAAEDGDRHRGGEHEAGRKDGQQDGQDLTLFHQGHLPKG